MKKIIVSLSVVLIIVGCASRKATTNTETPPATPPPTTGPATVPAPNAELNKIAATYPNYTVEQHLEGKKLYEANCGTCHTLYRPTSFAEFAWQEIVPDMVKKANRNKGANLDATQEELILKYVVSIVRSKQ